MNSSTLSTRCSTPNLLTTRRIGELVHEPFHGLEYRQGMRLRHLFGQGLARFSYWRGLTFAGFFPLVLLACPLCAAHAQQPSVLRYRFAIGDRSRGVLSGSVWLYGYSWYGLQSTKLANIENGLAEIPLDTEEIRRALNPHSNTDAYVFVLQFPKNTWFRSPDISPESIWKDLGQDLNSLGQSIALADGDTLLILPSPARRRITLLHEDGRPAVKAPVTVSIYLYDSNHCGYHTGLPLGNHVTDDTGTIEIAAPLLPLYLDNITYYQREGNGPAGQEYALSTGLKLGSELAVVVRKAWEFSGTTDLPEQEFDLLVVNSGGAPLPNVDVDETLRANVCGAVNGSIGQTDTAGRAHVRLVPQVVAKLELSRPNERPRPLSADELQELFARRTLAIKW